MPLSTHPHTKGHRKGHVDDVIDPEVLYSPQKLDVMCACAEFRPHGVEPRGCEGDISFFTSVLVPAAVSLQRTLVGYNAATVCPCVYCQWWPWQAYIWIVMSLILSLRLLIDLSCAQLLQCMLLTLFIFSFRYIAVKKNIWQGDRKFRSCRTHISTAVSINFCPTVWTIYSLSRIVFLQNLNAKVKF